jgi:hypothetical protein
MGLKYLATDGATTGNGVYPMASSRPSAMNDVSDVAEQRLYC